MFFLIKQIISSFGGEYVLTDPNDKNSNGNNIEMKKDSNDDGILKSKQHIGPNKKAEGKVTVYISGEILKPGLVSIDSGKRLFDAVEMLGGTTKDANLNGVNMAIKLEDGKHYIVPKIGETQKDETQKDETQKSTQDVDSKDGDDNSTQKININKADSKKLCELDGIGEKTADKIIKYREEKGKFNSVDDIKNVNGIGDKKFANIKDEICVN